MKKTTPYTTKTGLQIGSLYRPALPITTAAMPRPSSADYWQPATGRATPSQ